jgi:hypothetical protein
MACLFAGLGAEVVAVEAPGVDLSPAQALAATLGVSERVSFASASETDGLLDRQDFDFVFTKSVAVCIGVEQTLALAIRNLRSDGEYMGCENARLPRPLELLRRWRVGMSRSDVERLRTAFSDVEARRVWGVVWAFRASRSRSIERSFEAKP